MIKEGIHEGGENLEKRNETNVDSFIEHPNQ